MGATLESSSHLVHHGVGKLVRVGTRGETLPLFFRQKLPKTSLSHLPAFEWHGWMPSFPVALVSWPTTVRITTVQRPYSLPQPVSNREHTTISVPAMLRADAQGGTNVGIPNLPAPSKQRRILRFDLSDLFFDCFTRKR